eukprot:1190691-Prorocentrum_minimum.AAC.1
MLSVKALQHSLPIIKATWAAQHSSHSPKSSCRCICEGEVNNTTYTYTARAPNIVSRGEQHSAWVVIQPGARETIVCHM